MSLGFIAPLEITAPRKNCDPPRGVEPVRTAKPRSQGWCVAASALTLAIAGVAFASLFGWAYASWQHAAHCDDIVMSGKWIAPTNSSEFTHYLTDEGMHYTGGASDHECHAHWTSVHKRPPEGRRLVTFAEILGSLAFFIGDPNPVQHPCTPIQVAIRDNSSVWTGTWYEWYDDISNGPTFGEIWDRVDTQKKTCFYYELQQSDPSAYSQNYCTISYNISKTDDNQIVIEHMVKDFDVPVHMVCKSSAPAFQPNQGGCSKAVWPNSWPDCGKSNVCSCQLPDGTDATQHCIYTYQDQNSYLPSLFIGPAVDRTSFPSDTSYPAVCTTEGVGAIPRRPQRNPSTSVMSLF